MNKETLKLTGEEARAIVCGDTDGFDIVEDKITENTRWSIVHVAIAKRKSDGKFFLFCYSVGATESQEEQPYEHEDNVEIKEVFPVEKKIIVYE